MKRLTKRNRAITSAAIALASLGLAYAPLPGLEQTVVVVSGTELVEPLQKLEAQFEQKYPNINLELKFQGSQDLVNNYIDDRNDFKPTVLIPASAQMLEELSQRWHAQYQSEPFYEPPQPIAKTFLVGVAWPQRGQVLFPKGRFSWRRLEQAMEAGNWQKIGGPSEWGSFDFITTDPTRSNSGQITLSLWALSKSKGSNLDIPGVKSLFSTIKRSVYQPPRSTDILLQEFIAQGPNDADVATVYESIALHRWQQSGANQNKPYQIYYLDPTIETIATAAIVRRDVDAGKAKAARQFIGFLRQPQQQQVIVQYGFRPIVSGINLRSVPNSPWVQNIPGAEIDPSMKLLQSPDTQEVGEIQRLWERAN